MPQLAPDVPDAGSDGAGVLPPPSAGFRRVLTVTSLQPDAGPFSGGNTVMVRGSGFTADAEVVFGEQQARAQDVELVDDNTLAVVVPAAEAGRVDVRVRVGSDVAARVDAYLYNGIEVSPAQGSAAGGTLVRVSTDGTELAPDVQVFVGEAACDGVTIIAPLVLSCIVPPGAIGLADVTIEWPTERERLRALRAFEYVDPGDTFKGGLSGGPIDGAINLTVVDTVVGLKLPGADVLLVDAEGNTIEGMTNADGQLTLSAEGLQGPVSVHVFRTCFESQSILDFDARDVTLYTRVTETRECETANCIFAGRPPKCCDPATADADECGGKTGLPPAPSGRGVSGSVVSGELVFPGEEEFGVNPWDNVPPPRQGEVRVAYIYATRRTLFSNDVEPNQAGLTARVEELTSPFGERGYPYSIFARPAGLAVYALAGVEDETGKFVPYVMGVTRDVLTSPGQESPGVDIWMGIPLDRGLQVALTDLPGRTPRGPLEYRVQAHIDLGGEGVIARIVNGALFDSQSQFSAESVFEFYAQPALEGSLLGAPYVLYAGWYSGSSRPLLGSEYPDPPYTEQVVPGVRRSDAPTVLDGFLAIPKQVRPAPAGRIPADQVLGWALDGNAPDLLVALIQSSTGAPLWRIIMPGTRRDMHLPRIEQLPVGLLTWRMHAANVEGFDYDSFNYDYLSSRLWTHEALDDLLIQR